MLFARYSLAARQLKMLKPSGEFVWLFWGLPGNLNCCNWIPDTAPWWLLRPALTNYSVTSSVQSWNAVVDLAVSYFHKPSSHSLCKVHGDSLVVLACKSVCVLLWEKMFILASFSIMQQAIMSCPLLAESMRSFWWLIEIIHRPMFANMTVAGIQSLQLRGEIHLHPFCC